MKQQENTMITFNGRELQDVTIDGVHHNDYPDYCDAYIVYAEYADTGEQLTIQELDELQDQQPELVYELIQDAGY
jgi:hypothetical protein